MNLFAEGGIIKDPNQELLDNTPIDPVTQKIVQHTPDTVSKPFGGIPKPLSTNDSS